MQTDQNNTNELNMAMKVNTELKRKADTQTSRQIHDHDLTELFYDVVRQLNQLAKSCPQDRSPLSGQYKCLFLLEEAGTLPQKKLGQILEIRSTSLSELLAKLEKKGYIQRTPSPQDKRAYFITVTPAGKEEVNRVRSIRLKEHHELTEPLTETEKSDLYTILSKIKKYYTRGEVL